MYILVCISIGGESGAMEPPWALRWGVFADRSRVVHLLWVVCVFFCLVFVVPLCASVYLCLVVACWGRTDLLALVCGVKL